MVEDLCLQGVFHKADELIAIWVVEVTHSQGLLHLGDPFFGEGGHFVFFRYGVVFKVG